MIEVSEIFNSIQGEGPSCGQPALFLRLRRCNLRCRWCDSKYTWDPKDWDYSEYTLWTEEELVDRLRSLIENRILVITGGEPLIWKRHLLEMLPKLTDVPRIEIETNGTISPGRVASFHNVYFNVSPKLTSSGNGNLIRVRKDVLREFVKSGRAIFKFVVTGKFEVSEVEAFERGGASPVWVMPEGITIESQLRGLKWLAPVAIEKNWSISSRLQILAFGNRRGT